LYKRENDSKVKERATIANYQSTRRWTNPFSCCKKTHKSNPWASDWLKRYDKESLEELKDRAKAGRPSDLSEEISHQIKKELKESNKQGWTTKLVEELIIKKSGIKYHYAHIYRRILRKWGFKQKVPKRCMLILHLWMKKRFSKKRLQNRYLWTSSSRNNNNKKFYYSIYRQIIFLL
jgi:putative transposase